jgi:NitT/TauT family transport system permease protein
MEHAQALQDRPEFEVELEPLDGSDDAAEAPSSWGRLRDNDAVRRLVVLVVIAVVWEIYARILGFGLLFPSFGQSMAALWDSAVHGDLLLRIGISMRALLVGYSIGILLAAVLTTFAVSTRVGTDLLSTLTAMFNPLPAIALLPLALLWFGLGTPSLVFVIVHSVLWAVSLNTHAGFRSVSDTLRMAGANYGLRGTRYVVQILIPAAFPSILAGLKIGWAFAWRTLIAAELVFGASSSSGGLGWFIFENRNQLNTANVFAGLVTVIIIGLAVEAVLFRWIETHTVKKWGMQR